MPRKPQQQRSKVTVNAIIEAGFLSVAERGVADTTARYIAEKAGVGVGSLYEYFENKEAIFDAMCQRFVADVVDFIEPMIEQLAKMSIRDAVLTLLKHFETFLNQDEGRYLGFIQHALQIDIRQYIEPMNKMLQDFVLQYLMRNPEYVKLTTIPEMSYIFINGGIFTVVQHLTDPNPPISFEELINGLANMVSHYVAEELFLIEEENGM